MHRALGALRILLATAFPMFIVAGCASVPASDVAGRFEFGLIGDQQYDAESIAKFPNIMAELNRADLAFVVHVGDIGSTAYNSCTDETYYRRRDEFNQSRHPFVFTPGDNEWTDCHRGGRADPLERLAKLREVLFQGNNSLGRRTLPLARQSDDPRYAKFSENARWTHGGVVFTTLNIPGSNNNLGRTPQMDAEYAERNAADIDWMRQTFRQAKQENSRAVMFLIQANPRFEDAWPAGRRAALGIAPPPQGPSGYAEFMQALLREVLDYEKPVVLAHGDTHYFRVDSPMILDDGSGTGRTRVVENLIRVEIFGYPEAHWVRATVDPADPNVFSFRPGLVKENLRNRGGR
jgi:hypothetical protein